MSQLATGARIPTSNESVPFLDPGGGDFDLELQSIGSRQGSRRATQLRTHSPSSRNERHDGFEGYGKRESSAFATALRYCKSALSQTSTILASRGKRWSLSRKRMSPRQQIRETRPSSVVWRVCLVFFVILGTIQLATVLLGVLTAFFPDQLDSTFRSWREHDKPNRQSHWPTDYTADIRPVACHSHNDYWRTIPLISAIKAGCTGVEADVWLTGDDLHVGHAESALTANRTFTSLYVDPLVDILDRQNPKSEYLPSNPSPRHGVFDTDASQTLVLLIDFKTSYELLWPVVEMQLTPLRERQYLTHFNGSHVIQGPVTVVVTGNAPFELAVQDLRHRDMFFDAPLDALAVLAGTDASLAYNPSLELDYLASLGKEIEEVGTVDKEKNQGQGNSGHPPKDPAVYMLANSYYASVDFQASIGRPQPYLSQDQRDKIAAQIAGAHVHGLKVRYWNVPSWPVGLRNYLWRELVKMGIDYLNVDDLKSATKGDWRSGHSIWDWSLWGGRDW